MENISIYSISFTKKGALLNEKIQRELKERGHDIKAFSKSDQVSSDELIPLEGSLAQWTKEAFHEAGYILFIGAVGIGVRSIAPFIKDKFTDPGVIVIDESGRFVISLLSGHYGGANEMTEALAGIVGGTAVITTATDINGKFAVDVFAKKNQLYLSSSELAKKISARILSGEPVGFYSDFPVAGDIPQELQGEDGLGIALTFDKGRTPFKETLYLIPPLVTLGIGCKKGTQKVKLAEWMEKVLAELKIFPEAIEKIASIDLKKDEKGLIEVAADYGIPFVTYSGEELREVEGNFSESDFVKSITGVSNVCERSAVKGSNGGKLLQKKLSFDGMTIAVAIREWGIHFG